MAGDDDMERVALDRADLAKEKRVHVAVDDRGEEQLAVVCAVHLQGLVKIAPLVFGRLGLMHPQPE